MNEVGVTHSAGFSVVGETMVRMLRKTVWMLVVFVCACGANNGNGSDSWRDGTQDQIADDGRAPALDTMVEVSTDSQVVTDVEPDQAVDSLTDLPRDLLVDGQTEVATDSGNDDAETQAPTDSDTTADTDVSTEVSSDVVQSDILVPEPGAFLWPCSEDDECLSGWCMQTKDGGRCTKECTDDCPMGWVCAEVDAEPPVHMCIFRFLTLCDPCMSDGQCEVDHLGDLFVDLCLAQPDGSGSFCGADCSGDPGGCPLGYSCEPVDTPGGPSQQCLPLSGECSCSAFAIQEEKTTTCESTNQFGTCIGTQTCTVYGLGECTAKVPEEEICDGEDNDCDGFSDESCDDDGDGFCDWNMSVVGIPLLCQNGGGDCDDSNPDTFPGAEEVCDSEDNDCNGAVDDGLCDDGNPCTDDICDPLMGCSHVWNESPCDDDNSCTVNDHCIQGDCVGVEMNCDDGNMCTDDLCNPEQGGGCYWVNNTNGCTDDGNPCTADGCGDGVCLHQPANGVSCDDGNPCTDGDFCQSAQCVPGAPTNCDDENDCTVDSCDPGQGCTHNADDGAPCVYDVIDGVCEVDGFCDAEVCVPESNCQCADCNFCVCCGIIQVCLDGIF